MFHGFAPGWVLLFAFCEGCPVNGVDGGDGSIAADANDANDANAATPCIPGHSLESDHLRVLFLGNSQTYFWDLGQIVAVAANSAANGPTIEPDQIAPGGANLRSLWEETDAPSRIATGGYDVVVIQESIDLAEPDRYPQPEQFIDYGTRFVDAARDSGAVPIFLSTSYVEDLAALPARTGFAEMYEPQRDLGSELGIAVAAGGETWRRVWEDSPETDFYDEDRQHPGFVGSYAYAAVLYAAITGRSPVGLTHVIEYESTGTFGFACNSWHPCGTIDEETAAAIQIAAYEQYLATNCR